MKEQLASLIPTLCKGVAMSNVFNMKRLKENASVGYDFSPGCTQCEEALKEIERLQKKVRKLEKEVYFGG